MTVKSDFIVINGSKTSTYLCRTPNNQVKNRQGQLINMPTKLSFPSFKCAKLLTIAALSSVCLSPTVNAKEFLCDATQSSTQELPILASSCPIGSGVWGKQQPKGNESTFWIQCGVLSKPLTVSQAKVIYPHISTDVWAKIEGNVARCLIGPYQDFALAKQELIAVKKLPPYREAFIREVVRGGKPVKQAKPVMTAKVTQPKVQPQPKPPSVQRSSDQPRMYHQPVVTPQSTALTSAAPTAAPVRQAPIVSASSQSMDISIRREVKIGNLHYKVPYLPLSDDQFYMEYDKPWTRVDFGKASRVCKQLNMTLPNRKQWQTLLDAKIMESNQWPMHLPYWGTELSAMFTNGRVTSTSGKSLLNIMCVQQS